MKTSINRFYQPNIRKNFTSRSVLGILGDGYANITNLWSGGKLARRRNKLFLFQKIYKSSEAGLGGRNPGTTSYFLTLLVAVSISATFWGKSSISLLLLQSLLYFKTNILLLQYVIYRYDTMHRHESFILLKNHEFISLSSCMLVTTFTTKNIMSRR